MKLEGTRVTTGYPCLRVPVAIKIGFPRNFNRATEHPLVSASRTPSELVVIGPEVIASLDAFDDALSVLWLKRTVFRSYLAFAAAMFSAVSLFISVRLRSDGHRQAPRILRKSLREVLSSHRLVEKLQQQIHGRSPSPLVRKPRQGEWHCSEIQPTT